MNHDIGFRELLNHSCRQRLNAGSIGHISRDRCDSSVLGGDDSPLAIANRLARRISDLMVDTTQLQATLDKIPAYAWYANPTGGLTFVNTRCADYLGLPSDHPLRWGFDTGAAWDSHLAFLHPDDTEENAASLVRLPEDRLSWRSEFSSSERRRNVPLVPQPC